MAKPPKNPIEEILTDPGDPGERRPPIQIVGLDKALERIKSDKVQVWTANASGRRAAFPGPDEGGMWPTSDLRSGDANITSPYAIIEDPSTGLVFRVKLSAEMEMGTQRPNGIGQYTSQNDGVLADVVKQLAGLIVERDKDIWMENRRLQTDAQAKDRRIAELELEVEKSNSQPEGVVESTIANFSKTEHGQSIIAGIVSDIAERFSKPSKS